MTGKDKVLAIIDSISDLMNFMQLATLYLFKVKEIRLLILQKLC